MGNFKGFGAVILAAGYSSRMGKFKPLLHVGGEAAIDKLINSVSDAGIDDIIVVTGHNADALRTHIVGRATEVYNDKYDTGMFSSVKAGLAKCKTLSQKRGFFLLPVDCPLIDSSLLTSLMQAIEDAPADIFMVPVFEGKKGHPLFVPGMYVDEICEHDGSGGLKRITDKYWDHMVRIPTDDEGCLLDMDTPEGYAEICEFADAGKKREALQALAEGRRICLVRHGETEQHAEKMFIGCYDVPLSDAGREMMERTAADIARLDMRVNRVYCSDLSRCTASAEIVASGLNARICPTKDLREINLGSWDGKPIREIREKCPELYERRGRDIFTFKTGNKAENFYDLQYRAVKALRKILERDKSRDIVVVTHSGVIRALENNLKGRRVDDAWDKIQKGEFVLCERA